MYDILTKKLSSISEAKGLLTNVGDSTNAQFGFVIPQGSNGADGAQGPAGPAGSNGADGAAGTIAVAWTSNGVPGSAVIVTNVGDSTNAQFGFVIPQGSNGADGVDYAATNIIVIEAGTNMQFTADGNTNRLHAVPTNGLFYLSRTRRIAITNDDFGLQVLAGEVWSNILGVS